MKKCTSKYNYFLYFKLEIWNTNYKRIFWYFKKYGVLKENQGGAKRSAPWWLRDLVS